MNIDEIEQENETLKKRLVSLEKELNEVKKNYSGLRKNFGSFSTEEDDSGKKTLQHRFYKNLLEKYSQTINESEKNTVGEIKNLIDKEDLSVNSILQELKPEKYSYPENYLETAEKTFQYLLEEIKYVKPEISINFWLKPKEVLEFGVSDDEDFAVLLCTFLCALEDEKAEVVIAELENLSTHAFVLTQFEDKTLLLDPCQKHSFKKYFGEREKILKEYEFEGFKIKRFLYKFNNSNYEQFL